MDIMWHGYSCFTIKTKNCVAVIDPYSKEVGIKPPELKGDVVFISHHHKGHDNVAIVEGYKRIIDWPGEYEVKGMAIIAKTARYTMEGTEKKPGEGLIFTIEIDGIKLCFLGDMGEVKDENFIEGIGDVDILFLPVGGHDTMNAKQAHELVEEIEPRVVIPMHYALDGDKSSLDSVEGFLKLMGSSAVEPKEKFTVSSRSELSGEKTECVVLKPKNE